MDDSPFAKLPRELRDQITTLALTSEKGVVECDCIDPTEVLIHECGWPFACKQAHMESGSLFYSSNHFHFRQDTEEDEKGRRRMIRMLRTMTSINLQAIRSIRFDPVRMWDWSIDLSSTYPDHPETLKKQWEQAIMIKDWIHPDATIAVYFHLEWSVDRDFMRSIGAPRPYRRIDYFWTNTQMLLTATDLEACNVEIDRGFANIPWNPKFPPPGHTLVQLKGQELKANFKKLLGVTASNSLLDHPQDYQSDKEYIETLRGVVNKLDKRVDEYKGLSDSREASKKHFQADVEKFKHKEVLAIKLLSHLMAAHHLHNEGQKDTANSVLAAAYLHYEAKLATTGFDWASLTTEMNRLVQLSEHDLLEPFAAKQPAGSTQSSTSAASP